MNFAKNQLLTIVVLALSLYLPFGHAMHAADWKEQQGNFTVSLQLSGSQLALNEQVHLEAELIYPSEYAINQEQILKHLLWHVNAAQWELMDKQIETTTEHVEKVTRMHLLLAPLQTGTLSLSFLGITFTSAKAKEIFWTPVFKIEVLPAEAAEEIPLRLFPLTPQYPLSVDTANENRLAVDDSRRNQLILASHSFPWFFLLLTICGSFAYVLGRFIYNHRRMVMPHGPDPRIHALDRLDAAWKKRQESGEGTLFFNEITPILRCYLEEQFLLFSMTKTTQEFLHSIEKADIQPEFRNRLREILMQVDQVNFAGHVPTQEECESVYHQARQFISFGNS